MAQVISTKVTMEQPQADGRRWVHLVHTLDDGTTEESSTLIDASTTPTRLRDARVKDIDARPEREPPDAFLTKLEEARTFYYEGRFETAAETLGDAMDVAMAATDAVEVRR